MTWRNKKDPNDKKSVSTTSFEVTVFQNGYRFSRRVNEVFPTFILHEIRYPCSKTEKSERKK